MLVKQIVKRLIRTTGYEISKAPSSRKPQKPAYPKYNQDSLITVHNHDFMKDPKFITAYERGVKADKDHKWHRRVHVAL
jgi:hypothetical protein